MLTRPRIFAPAALTLALILGACHKENKTDNTLAQDTTLSRDLQLANRDTAAQPQLSDVPAAPAPAPAAAPTPAPKPKPKPVSHPAPAPAPAPTTTASGNVVEHTTKGSEPGVATIAAGTSIGMTSNDKICTNTNHVGDRFTATVDQAVVGSNGAVIPAGAKAVIVVTQLKKSNNANDPIQMTFNVQSLSWNGKSYPVDASIDHVDVEKVRNSSTGNDAKKVVGGAVVGAILGRIIGGNTKGTIIGAATGAAAGTAVAMGTADYEGCIPQGGKITIKLNSPAQVQAE